MLKIFHSLRDLRFSALLDVYKNSLAESSQTDHEVTAEDQIKAQQEFYYYLKDCFFRDSSSFYAVWELHGRYMAALRIEEYRDGFLLAALQTAPEARNRGYATLLITGTLDYLSAIGKKPVYAHVDKENSSSMRVHEKCGFTVFSETAAYIDGSFSSAACTMIYEFTKKQTD